MANGKILLDIADIKGSYLDVREYSVCRAVFFYQVGRGQSLLGRQNMNYYCTIWVAKLCFILICESPMKKGGNHWSKGP